MTTLSHTAPKDDRSFSVAGKNFKLNKMDAFRQFHVVRRIGPLLTEMIPAFAKMAGVKTSGQSEAEKLEEFAALAGPVMAGLSKLSDQDADYVLFRLLSCVEVEQPQFHTWAKIATDSQIMMQDLELPILLQAAGRALMYNLSGFFALLPRQG